MNIFQILSKMFLGNSPNWYKSTILAFLILNPILLLILNEANLNGSFIVGWIFLLEFIFTLALALKCYPLQPGGLLAIQAIALGLTTPYHVLYEIEHNLEVIRTADWIIDMGPEGGSGGGKIISERTPEHVAKNKNSYTGIFLNKKLN